ncbi:hypothetical protein KAI87_16610, partial [Myxococcota bacterium]|nr:hypothetical protein [Myxococcota bacterium]
MQKRFSYLLITTALFGLFGLSGILVGCQNSDATATASLKLQMPLEIATADLVTIEITQDGETQSLELNTEGMVTVSIQADVEATITALIMSADATATPKEVALFTGETTFTPPEGESTEELILDKTPGRTGSLIPILQNAAGDTAEIPNTFLLKLVDVQSTIAWTDFASTGDLITLPEGREFTLSLTDLTETTITHTVTADDLFDSPQTIVVGDFPTAPLLDDLYTNDGSINMNDVTHDPNFGVKCAIGSCETATTYVDCSLITQIDTDTTFQTSLVSARYTDFPDICSESSVIYDVLPPSVDLRFTPTP